MHTIPSPTSSALTVAWSASRADPAATATVAGWAGEHSALSHCRTLADVEQALAPRADADPAWAAVIDLSKSGDDLATRALIQALLPQYRGIARRCAASHTNGDVDEALAVAIHGLLQLLPRYDTTRRHHHRNSLGLAGLKHLTRSTRLRIGDQSRERPTGYVDQLTCNAGAALEILRVDSSDRVARLLRWAASCRIITAAEASTLARMYAGPHYRGSADLRSADQAEQMLRQRHARALRKLRRALTGPLGQDLISQLAA